MKIMKLYIPPTLIAYSIVLMLLFHFLLPQFNLIPFPWNLAGILISFGAFMYTGRVRDLFRKYQTTVKIKNSNKLIREGPFSVSRNPMYICMSLLILGFAILSSNLLSLALPLLFVILVSLIFVPKEEKLLEESFGEEYADYKKKVSRWI